MATIYSSSKPKFVASPRPGISLGHTQVSPDTCMLGIGFTSAPLTCSSGWGLPSPLRRLRLWGSCPSPFSEKITIVGAPGQPSKKLLPTPKSRITENC